MRVSTVLARLRQHAEGFRRAEGGNIAVLFAIALLPILGFIGAAVDYSRASNARSSMQAALDSVALMVSRDFSTGKIKATDINTTAQAYFNALYTNTEGKSVTVDAVYTPNTGKGSTVRVSGTGTVTTEFMKLVGIPSMAIGSASTTTWGSVRLRVALVLDTTGSMASAGKMDALKTATQSLLTKLKDSGSAPDDVYVSIVPFSKDVNVGSSNYTASWVDWTSWKAEPPALDYNRGGSKPNSPTTWKNVKANSNCPFTDAAHGFVCTDRPATLSGAKTVTKIPSSGKYSGLICPSIDTGGKDGNIGSRNGLYYNGCYDSVTRTVSSCTGYNSVECGCTGSGSSKVCSVYHTWRPADTVTTVTQADLDATPATSTWNGCVTERGTATGPSGDYDRLATAPSSGTQASLFPAEQMSTCPLAVTALNNDWTAMATTVTNLSPNGGTNQPIGLVWGWQSLVGGGPFPTPPAKDPQYTYQEIIVLMSDGLNTVNRWNGDGSNTSTDVDKRMYESDTVGTCANIKDAKIKIYAVHVNTDGGAESTLLKNCASKSDDGGKEFQMVTSASGITTAFDSIATKLTKLRIAF